MPTSGLGPARAVEIDVVCGNSSVLDELVVNDLHHHLAGLHLLHHLDGRRALTQLGYEVAPHRARHRPSSKNAARPRWGCRIHVGGRECTRRSAGENTEQFCRTDLRTSKTPNPPEGQ